MLMTPKQSEALRLWRENKENMIKTAKQLGLARSLIHLSVAGIEGEPSEDLWEAGDLILGFSFWFASEPKQQWRNTMTSEHKASDMVRAPLCIEAPDVQIDAYGDYDADTGALRSVIIDGRHISPASVASAMRLLGHEPWGWDDDLDGDRLSELVAEAASDAEADWADRQRDMREDW